MAENDETNPLLLGLFAICIGYGVFESLDPGLFFWVTVLSLMILYFLFGWSFLIFMGVKGILTGAIQESWKEEKERKKKARIEEQKRQKEREANKKAWRKRMRKQADKHIREAFSKPNFLYAVAIEWESGESLPNEFHKWLIEEFGHVPFLSEKKEYSIFGVYFSLLKDAMNSLNKGPEGEQYVRFKEADISHYDYKITHIPFGESFEEKQERKKQEQKKHGDAYRLIDSLWVHRDYVEDCFVVEGGEKIPSPLLREAIAKQKDFFADYHPAYSSDLNDSKTGFEDWRSSLSYAPRKGTRKCSSCGRPADPGSTLCNSCYSASHGM